VDKAGRQAERQVSREACHSVYCTMIFGGGVKKKQIKSKRITANERAAFRSGLTQLERVLKKLTIWAILTCAWINSPGAMNEPC
jgi:hypothetical protein